MDELKVVVLGAGFAGLELTTMLSEELGDELDLTLIDRNDCFVFGFSKLDVMFGREEARAVRLPYDRIRKPGVQFRRETVTKIDPKTRQVHTDAGTYQGDALVIALGADYHVAATPGLAEAGNEFYSVAGAEALRERISSFAQGNAIVGAACTLYKCPPAAAEAALLLSDYLTAHGTRDSCRLSLVIPSEAPPPGPASKAFLGALSERGISVIPNHHVRELDPARRVAILNDARELPYDLFLGIPHHRVPDVVAASGMAEHGWIHVNPRNLETDYPGVYAVGDVTDVEAPMVGVFAEEAARVVAKTLIAQRRRSALPPPFTGAGSCYIEFGGGRVGRADMDFLSGPQVSGSFAPPSFELAAEKKLFAATRRERWFGL